MSDFPANWQIASDFDPNAHLMNLKGRDYLNVQSRMLWFIRDQRALIAAGLATEPYVLRTELVELDREAGWAHFRTVARDVLGNESVMYGSESAKDFADYIEKASTKSLGRALLGLGYGTAFAPEMDEGERVVDAPVERRQHATPARATATPAARAATQRATTTPAQERQPAPAQSDAGRPTDGPTDEGATFTPATDQQAMTIRRLCDALGRAVPVYHSFTDASRLIQELNGAVKQQKGA